MRLPRNMFIILSGTGALDLLFRWCLREVAVAPYFNSIFKSTANAISARFGWSEATVIGGLAIAGSGGNGGAFGPGGHARATDHGSIGIEGFHGAGDIGAGGPDINVESRDGPSVIGGEGGETNQRDGSGERDDRSSSEVLHPHGGPHGGMLADCGPRGCRQDTAECDQKLSVVGQLRKVYAMTRIGSSSAVLDDKNSVPLDWINQQLAALGAQWRVRIVRGEYEFLPLPAFWPRELISDRNLLARAQPHFGVQ